MGYLKMPFHLERGTLVRAVRHIDPAPLERPYVCADVLPGTYGVVFEEENAYDDGCGPMVRWVPQPHRMFGSACNVYPGDVEIVESPHKENQLHGFSESSRHRR